MESTCLFRVIDITKVIQDREKRHTAEFALDSFLPECMPPTTKVYSDW
jgi:hypothetical protein